MVIGSPDTMGKTDSSGAVGEAPISAPGGGALRPREVRRWLVEYPRGIPLAMFALIAAITGLSIYSIERGETDRRIAQLNGEAQTLASAIERRGDAASAYLQAGAVLFETRSDISNETFGEYVDSLRLKTDYFGADGIGWAEALPPSRLASFEAELSAATGAPFRVSPRPRLGTNQIVPVTYLYPNTERNRRAVGFDMYSEPVRQAAIDEAERSVRPTASGRIVLAQEGKSDAPGFLVYMPVYSRQPDGPVLQGFIYSPFNAANFLADAITLPPDYHRSVRLYDGKPDLDNLIGELGAPDISGLAVTQPVNFANRPMTLELEAGGHSGFSALSLATLIFGLLVASLLLVVLRLLTRQAVEDQAALAWLEEQDSIRDSLTRELNHRVKNALANVLSIIALTRRRTTDIDQFADGLEGRVRAMSATHDLLTRSEWGTTPLHDVVEAEVALYLNDEDHHIEIAGPVVQLAPGDALSLGLAVHELTTNAARHGALGRTGGKVAIRWELVRPDLVRVIWHETGGPGGRPTGRDGFGLQLIERIVAHELGQPVEIEFGENGMSCVMLVPVRLPSDFALRARHRA